MNKLCAYEKVAHEKDHDDNTGKRKRHIGLHLTTLHRSEQQSKELCDTADQAHDTVKNKLIEPAACLRADERDAGGHVDDAIDHIRIEPRNDPREEQYRIDKKKLVEFIKEKLPVTEPVDRSESTPKSSGNAWLLCIDQP